MTIYVPPSVSLTEPTPSTEPPIPLFEGKLVDGTTLKVTNASVLDLTDVVLGVDDVIRIVVEARVVGVNHIVHEPSGKLLRVHTAKAYDARLVPPPYESAERAS